MEGAQEPLGVGGAWTLLAFPGIISARLMEASTRALPAWMSGEMGQEGQPLLGAEYTGWGEAA